MNNKKKFILTISAGALLLMTLIVSLWSVNQTRTLPEINGPLSISIQRRATSEEGTPTVENYDFNIPVGDSVLEDFSSLFNDLSFHTCTETSVTNSGMTQFSVMYMSGAKLENSVVLSFNEASDYLRLSVVTTEGDGVKKHSAVLKAEKMDEWRTEFYELLRQSADYMEQR